jgi:hypothetical protein
MMRRPLLAALAVAIVAALAFAGATLLTTGPGPASAQVGSVDNVSIDMDPGAAPANTATSVGSVETCAEVINDDVLNADEDGPADHVLADLVVHPLGIPPSPPDGGMVGFSYYLVFADGVVVVTAADNAQLLAAMGLNPMDLSHPTPDAVSPWRANVADLLGGQETGPGIITRFTLEGVGPGLSPLWVSTVYILDGGSGLAWPVDNMNGAVLAVDTSCPGPSDAKLLSQTVYFPAEIEASEYTPLTINKVIHNNGPQDPSVVFIETRVTLPSDCTTWGGLTADRLTIMGALPSVPVSTPAPYQEAPLIYCTELGQYQITVENCLELPSSDLDPSNNCQTDVIDFEVVEYDSDGDGTDDVVETACGSDPNDEDSIPERVDGAFALTDDDLDGEGTTEALPGSAAGFDCDGDGYPGGSTGLPDEEDRIFSTSSPATQRDQDPCGNDGWPSELFDGAGSENKIDLQDVTSYVTGTPPLKFESVKGGPSYDERWNLFNGTGSVDEINLQDIVALVSGPSRGGRDKPPMLGGARAFDGPECPWPP